MLAETILDNVVLLAMGMGLLIKGSGLFVQAAGTIARRMGVSELVIGLTLVAVGTSLPELVSAIIASLKNESNLVLGNVVGANIANITLIVGGAAVLRKMPIEREMLERDGYLALVAAAMLLLFALNSTISRVEGAVFALLFIAYTAFLVRSRQAYENAYHIRQFATYFFTFRYITEGAQALTRSMRESTATEEAAEAPGESFDWRNALLLAASVGLIVVGGNMLVDEAVFFAGHLELPVTLVGVVLALGTTAPEMSVSIAAARKGMGGMVIGNAIGSVLCNTFFVLGAASFIAPIAVSTLALGYALPFLIGVTLILLIFKRSDHEIRRLEGAGLCLLYIAFIVGYSIFV